MQDAIDSDFCRFGNPLPESASPLVGITAQLEQLFARSCAAQQFEPRRCDAKTAGEQIADRVVGLAVFGFVFALNSSVHSYLVLAYSEADRVSRESRRDQPAASG